MMGRTDRAQTGIDFLVGASVFLIAVGFVFAFVPSMFAPFGGSGVDDALIADRSATQLVERELVADPATPNVLDRSKHDEFFASCPSENGGEYLRDRLGLETTNLQVELGETCGEDPPSGSSTTVSQRLVSFGGEEGRETLYVRVWL